MHCDILYLYCDIFSSKHCLLFLALLEDMFMLQISGSSRTALHKHVLPTDFKKIHHALLISQDIFIYKVLNIFVFFKAKITLKVKVQSWTTTE